MPNPVLMRKIFKNKNGFVIAPVGWTWELPFEILQNGRIFSTNLDLQAYAGIVVATTYYVDRAMADDTGNGLTPATAFQKVTTALGKANVDRIYIKAGTYELGYTWGVTSPARNVEIIGYGGTVRLSAHRAGLAWVLDGAHYEVSQAVKIWNVWDASVLDANGDYTMLTRVANEAAVEATAGTWYWDDASDMLFVRTSDDRAPDADILPMETLSYGGYMNTAKTLYLEGLSFEGGAIAFGFSTSSAVTRVYAKNCTFKYCYNLQCVLMAGGNEAIMQNCISARNLSLDGSATDGFKAIESSGQYNNLALINCIGRHNGKAGDSSSNGYSRHSRGNTVVIGGEYYENYGRNIHDIDSGEGDPKTWVLGTILHDSGAVAGSNINISIGTTANTGGEMWLDSVTSYDSTVDIEANTDAIMYIRKLSPSNPVTAGGGTITPY